jgi:hypothetical protein
MDGMRGSKVSSVLKRTNTDGLINILISLGLPGILLPLGQRSAVAESLVLPAGRAEYADSNFDRG